MPDRILIKSKIERNPGSAVADYTCWNQTDNLYFHNKLLPLWQVLILLFLLFLLLRNPVYEEYGLQLCSNEDCTFHWSFIIDY